MQVYVIKLKLHDWRIIKNTLLKAAARDARDYFLSLPLADPDDRRRAGR